MFMHDGLPIACWIEISGWNASQDFFVEKTTLEWLESGVRRACVRTPLRPGSHDLCAGSQQLFLQSQLPGRLRGGVGITAGSGRIPGTGSGPITAAS